LSWRSKRFGRETGAIDAKPGFDAETPVWRTFGERCAFTPAAARCRAPPALRATVSAA